MADEHQRYERLAVGHVVGGLDEVDAARFRSHLVACRDCRTRVAELRGIASDLVATEREERAARAGAGRTELAERVEEEAPPRAGDLAPAASWPWRVVVIGLVPLVVLGALAWAVWMRGQVSLLQAVEATSASALAIAAEGEQLELDIDGAVGTVTGQVTVADERVLVALGSLPALLPDETLRAVLLDADDEVIESGTEFSQRALARGWLVDVLDASPVGVETVAVQRLQLPAVGNGVEPEVVQTILTADLPATVG